MSAETLRRAAASMRDRVETAPKETRTHVDVKGVWLNSAFYLTTTPAVALTVADWLDDTAAGWPWDDADPEVVDWDGDRMEFSESMDSRALAVARAYLGEVS